MEYSVHFRDLEDRLTELQDHLLPQLKEDEDYSSKEMDYIRGYRLLVHAEIEWYLESFAKEIALSCMRKWRENKELSKVILSIIAFMKVEYGLLPEGINDRNREIYNSIDKRIAKAGSNYIASINENHGIKEKNLVEMLLPLGIELNELDVTWLNTINSFGSSRGKVAHTSAKTQQLLNPKDELNTIEEILRGLKEIDLKMQSLMLT